MSAFDPSSPAPKDFNPLLPRFSKRTAWDTSESAWAGALRERRETGLKILDLTASNPTRCGFVYGQQEVLGALRNPAALHYDPSPRGILPAREAVCRYYAEHGVVLDPEHVLLATGTSEAYSFLFRLLCDPGDEVLIARPSYPLFDFLADLNDLRLVPYPLFYDYGWHLDAEALRQRITPRTRAIVVVHPNNPTGHFTRPAERLQLESICAEHGLCLIVDEVFLDYPIEWEAGPPASFASGDHPVLTFVLSGLSKVAGLPQMKAAWIALFGTPDLVQAAGQRLEVIADTFLSMNTAVQYAVPDWLAGRTAIQRQIHSRVTGNLGELDRLVARHPSSSRLRVDAGWSAALRIPAVQQDAETALTLLARHGVAVHSGDLYSFDSQGWLVLSLLTPSAEFLEGLMAISRYLKEITP
ncbi:MAG TPA: pyridoxal phosphate-dependent aminotransferase [Acidisarcina sp.]